jgi:hypothetical protein
MFKHRATRDRLADRLAVEELEDAEAVLNGLVGVVAWLLWAMDGALVVSEAEMYALAPTTMTATTKRARTPRLTVGKP